MSGTYTVCSRCVMDTSVPDITFDANGCCNYCTEFLGRYRPTTDLVVQRAAFDQFLGQVRANGRGKDYDCIIGLSGGVDSSYVLYLAVKNGLRPLAVHLDNGWNSELATHNIANLVRTLGIDLYTHVIDWEENRDMQLSFFKAHVLDIELLMDNAMLALNYQLARRHGLKFILAGTNQATEGMRMPRAWNWMKFDKRNIRAIHRQFGEVPIRTHPLISVLGFSAYEFLHGIHWTPFLDYVDFRKDVALDELKREVGYRPYPYKHYESVFTRFYQGYILPRKFGVDKRRIHLATLVVTGQMERDEALTMLTQSPYPDEVQMQEDKAFVMKKLGFTEASFSAYMQAPGVPHDHYPSERILWDVLSRGYKAVRSAVKK